MNPPPGEAPNFARGLHESLLRQVLGALATPFSYNPVRNPFVRLGVIWGIPLPILMLWLHHQFEDESVWTLAKTNPYHWFFMACPLLLGFVWGIGGTLFQNYKRQLQYLATHDGLTGLLNHAQIMEEGHRRTFEAWRYERPLSILLVDVDRFKRINDSYGHREGDRVLMKLAEVLRTQVRHCDLLGRYGGEEYLVLLPETSPVGAKTVGERLRRRVEAHDFGLDDEITVSLGAATYPHDGSDFEEILIQSDRRLYAAKDAGRNRILGSSALKTEKVTPFFPKPPEPMPSVLRDHPPPAPP